jgi:DNA repair exonuclease SbcCD ATPase subunit
MVNMKNFLIISAIFVFTGCSNCKEQLEQEKSKLLTLQNDVKKYGEFKSEIPELEKQLAALSAGVATKANEYRSLPQEKKNELDSAVTALLEKKGALIKENLSLEEANKNLKTRYILKLRLKQSRVSINLLEQAKDEMNAAEFEMPVDKSFYDSVTVGSRLVDQFRTGSLVLSGSFSSWDVSVIGKREQK